MKFPVCPSSTVCMVFTFSGLTDIVWLKPHGTGKREAIHKRRNRGGQGGAAPPPLPREGSGGRRSPPPSPRLGPSHISRSRQDPSSFTHTIPHYWLLTNLWGVLKSSLASGPGDAGDPAPPRVSPVCVWGGVAPHAGSPFGPVFQGSAI